VPGTPFYAADPDPATLRLSFATHTADEITEGMGRLAAVFAGRPHS
jgi:DNA-binding transcriptional MocR family regulator